MPKLRKSGEVKSDRQKRLFEIAQKRQQGLIVVLEDVWDPHNASAVMRSCDAFGIQEVWLIFDKQKYWNPKKIGGKTSSSASKWLTFRIFRSTGECLKELKKNKYKIAVAAIGINSKPLTKFKNSNGKLAVVFGNEHSGVSQEIKEKADYLLAIPMRGFVDSLNISVAAGIFLYEISKNISGAKNSPIKTNLLYRDFLSR